MKFQISTRASSGLNWEDVINKRIKPEWIPKNKSIKLDLKKEHSLHETQEIATENTQLAFKRFTQVNLFKMSPMKNSPLY